MNILPREEVEKILIGCQYMEIMEDMLKNTDDLHYTYAYIDLATERIGVKTGEREQMDKITDSVLILDETTNIDFCAYDCTKWIAFVEEMITFARSVGSLLDWIAGELNDVYIHTTNQAHLATFEHSKLIFSPAHKYIGGTIIGCFGC